jgi:methylglutaconyl-CoA hydratase
MSREIELRREDAVLTVALNRPESHNAFTPGLVAELTAVFRQAADDETVRLIVLTGNGRSFCAGADLGYMRAAADYNMAENIADGRAIFDLMLAVDAVPKPVIGRINGSAIGGGAGLVSCCDSVAAVARASFAFSETRLGLVPAVISPFVVARIGTGHARELFLSGERFSAVWAREIGLVHHVANDETELDEMVAERIDQFLQAAPGALAAAKQLIRTVASRPGEDLRDYTSRLIAERRASDEGREGMSAFLEKRQPAWQQRGVGDDV